MKVKSKISVIPAKRSASRDPALKTLATYKNLGFPASQAQLRMATYKILLFLLLVSLINLAHASELIDRPLLPTHIDLHDSASLQRGARNFMNYCAGCHSLQNITYLQMAERIKLYNSDHEIYIDLLEENLIFTGAAPTDPIYSAMTNAQAESWFGAPAPDLSLIVRERSADWVYTYLNSFYADPNRPFGDNNLLLRNTAMPNVLFNLQGEQDIIYQSDKSGNISHLVMLGNGHMTPEQFQQFTRDTVNFLAALSAPPRPHKIELGFWLVCGFGLIFLLIFLIYGKIPARNIS